ncbi:MAG: GIY-YIG nuclease family protein [Lachnospiraceae bacterium]|nr:GIY-YIG nuclease family protein [Lachnospiraceae bacterium]MBR1877162.1 GIY-YIG nuclease family protein [Lachnospiraceae bacterium]
MIKKFYAYIAECSDGTYYTGFTTDLKKREDAHNSKKGAKYTRTRTPVRIIYHEEFATKGEAMKREYAIKQLSRDRKKELIRNGV